MAQEKKKQLLVSLPESLHRAAKIKAAETGKPMAQVMGEALEKWIFKGDSG
jgi:predicted HicB family RNase H-like nuclease